MEDGLECCKFAEARFHCRRLTDDAEHVPFLVCAAGSWRGAGARQQRCAVGEVCVRAVADLSHRIRPAAWGVLALERFGVDRIGPCAGGASGVRD